MKRVLFLFLSILLYVPAAFANHPVLVEGESDFDGDGIIGVDEDNDNDGVFGTINGALQSIAQNGSVLIVTSGRFAESVSITGQVTLEAAPGVQATVEAFIPADDPRLAAFPNAAADPLALQAAPGIVIDIPQNRRAVVRNITVSNWTNGIEVQGSSSVHLENIRAQNNINHGIFLRGSSRSAILHSTVTATGYRLNSQTGDFPSNDFMPDPGTGIFVADNARALIANSAVTGNFNGGIVGNSKNIRRFNTVTFSNQAGDIGLAPPADGDADDDNGDAGAPGDGTGDDATDDGNGTAVPGAGGDDNVDDNGDTVGDDTGDDVGGNGDTGGDATGDDTGGDDTSGDDTGGDDTGGDDTGSSGDDAGGDDTGGDDSSGNDTGGDDTGSGDSAGDSGSNDSPANDTTV